MTVRDGPSPVRAGQRPSGAALLCLHVSRMPGRPWRRPPAAGADLREQQRGADRPGQREAVPVSPHEGRGHERIKGTVQLARRQPVETLLQLALAHGAGLPTEGRQHATLRGRQLLERRDRHARRPLRRRGRHGSHRGHGLDNRAPEERADPGHAGRAATAPSRLAPDARRASRAAVAGSASGPVRGLPASRRRVGARPRGRSGRRGRARRCDRVRRAGRRARRGGPDRYWR